MSAYDPELERAYAVAATPYDRLVRPTFVTIARRLVGRLTPRPAERGLDVATGSGLVVEEIVRRAPGAVVIGLDPSAAMLCSLRAHAVVARPIRGVAGQLPFGTAVFDFVACQFGFHHFADPLGALQEAARVTRPGGRLGLAGWHDTEPPDRVEQLYQENLGRPRAADAAEAALPARDGRQALALAQAAGWSARLEWWRVPFTFPTAEAYYAWRTAFPGDAAWLSRQSPEQRQASATQVMTRLAEHSGGRPIVVTETVFALIGRLGSA